MSNRGETPYIIVERGGGGGVGAFVIGALLGAGAALLLAPRSGEETQAEIRAHAKKLRIAAEDRLREAQTALGERVETVRDVAEERIGAVRDAVDAGREAARDARVEMEERLAKSKAAYKAGIEAARETATAELPPETTAEA